MGRGEFEAGRSKERVAGKKGYARVLTGGARRAEHRNKKAAEGGARTV